MNIRATGHRISLLAIGCDIPNETFPIEQDLSAWQVMLIS